MYNYSNCPFVPLSPLCYSYDHITYRYLDLLRIAITLLYILDLCRERRSFHTGCFLDAKPTDRIAADKPYYSTTAADRSSRVHINIRVISSESEHLKKERGIMSSAPTYGSSSSSQNYAYAGNNANNKQAQVSDFVVTIVISS
jgi:hypothetical protein